MQRLRRDGDLPIDKKLLALEPQDAALLYGGPRPVSPGVVRVGINAKKLAESRRGHTYEPDEGVDFPLPPSAMHMHRNALYLVRVDYGESPWAVICTTGALRVGREAVAMIGGEVLCGVLESRDDGMYLWVYGLRENGHIDPLPPGAGQLALGAGDSGGDDEPMPPVNDRLPQVARASTQVMEDESSDAGSPRGCTVVSLKNASWVYPSIMRGSFVWDT